MTFFIQRKAGLASLSLMLAATAGLSSPARAHGIAGDRVFPATIATDDPAAASEISLPTVDWYNQPRNADGSLTSETDIGGELDVLVLPHFAVGIAPTWTSQTTKRETGNYGFQNLEVSGKYQFYTNDEHEIIMSAGVVAEVGGTGTPRVGSDATSTVTPTFYFGKGMGDLPDSMALLKPFAVTGTIGFAVPQSRTDADVFQPGIALEYSMPYLKTAVRDYDLPEFVNHLVPVVEFPLSLGLDQGNHDFGGTVNPGVIYLAQSWQFGVEAMVPLSAANQHGTGVIGQFHIFLDDLLPSIFAHPLFGGDE